MPASKFAMVSDVHLSSQNPVCRQDDLRQTQWIKLRYVYDTAVYRECMAVVLAGDLVDVACSWSLMPELAAFLQEYRGVIDTYVVFGQHDTYMYDATGRRKTIIGSLAAAGLLQILDDHPLALPNAACYLYGVNYGDVIQQHSVKGDAILVAHLPVCQQQLWAGQNYLDAAHFLVEHRSFRTILVGDIHRSFRIQSGTRQILNTGPLLRRKADEVDHHPHFYVYDYRSHKAQRVDVPHEPADTVINRSHLERDHAYDLLRQQLSSPEASTEAPATSIRFESILKEVALHNLVRMTPATTQMLATITGINLEKELAASGTQQKAIRRRR